MSIKLLAAELSRFLGSAEPEVLCITGKWGVGKTYAWNYYLKQAQESHNEKLAKYAYISLFGRNSLDDVRTAIVENTVNSRAAGEKPDLKSFKSVVSELAKASGNSADVVRADLLDGMMPGVHLVPAHTMLVGLAQEKGFTYESL